MQLYFKCIKNNKIISKKNCELKTKCSECEFKEHITINWKCKRYGMDIKKKWTYCEFRKSHNIRCEGCSYRGENFEARFNT